MTRNSHIKSPNRVWWWLLYVAFVVYGSLVPLELVPLSFDAAWDKFRAIQLLDVGLQGRGDWVSNGVLYVPIGFLTFNLLGRSSGTWQVLAALLALVFSAALAAGVEFVQVYFPGRTVSLNDLFAEWVGGLLGVCLAVSSYHQFLRLGVAWRSLALQQILNYGLVIYVVLYLSFSFFPFDFVLSATELQAKYESRAWGLLFADDFRSTGWLWVGIKLFAEVLAVVPIGVMLSRLQPAASYKTGVGYGVVLGVVLEVGQFFVFSSLAQGVSILMRAAGMVLGISLYRRWTGNMESVRWKIQRRVLPLFLGYLFALAAIHGWFRGEWQGFDAAWSDLDSTRFLPFYYHYFTTEQAALVSVVAVAAMYAPMGIVTWATRSSPGFTWIATACVVSFFECSKLFLKGLHADPTNIFIGGTAAWAVRRGLRFVRTVQARSSAKASTGKETYETLKVHNKAAIPSAVMPIPSTREIAILCLVMLPTLVLAATFSGLNLVLPLALIGLAVAIWRQPVLALPVVPVALVNLDLAPWTGRLLLDEFDLLMVVVMTIGFLRTAAPGPEKQRDRLMNVAVLALGGSYLISVVTGLLPWRVLDTNVLSSYYSPLNGMRVAKGLLWAALFYRLMHRFTAEGKPAFGLFSLGMVLSTLGVVASTVWERFTFPGIMNFADEYRVTGPFSAMHVGGADLELFLTLAVPFLVLAIYQAASWGIRSLLLALFLGATYVLAVSFARIGLAGYGIAVVASAVLLAHSRSGGKSKGSRLPDLAGAAVLILLVVGVGMPIVSGEFAQSRLAKSGQDFEVRVQHWKDVLAMRDGGTFSTLFGLGVGRYPEVHHWLNGQNRAASYGVAEDEKGPFLRLGKGHAVYIDQIVDIEPSAEYMFQALLRSPVKNSELTIAICEKWLLTSLGCVEQKVSVGSSNQWAAYNLAFNSGEIGSVFGRRVKISLFNSGNTSALDIRLIALRDEKGSNLVKNGGFKDGMDHWFFSTDIDLPWHIWNLPVHLIFEQGWFGLLAFGFFLVGALVRVTQASWAGNQAAAVLLGGTLGFSVISSMDTGIDTPRMLMLVVLLLLLALKEKSPNFVGRSA